MHCVHFPLLNWDFSAARGRKVSEESLCGGNGENAVFAISLTFGRGFRLHLRNVAFKYVKFIKIVAGFGHYFNSKFDIFKLIYRSGRIRRRMLYWGIRLTLSGFSIICGGSHEKGGNPGGFSLYLQSPLKSLINTSGFWLNPEVLITLIINVLWTLIISVLWGPAG